MNDYLLLALELYKAAHRDLLRQAEEHRLGRAVPAKRPPWLARLLAMLSGMHNVAQLSPRC
jgi:hypothetical protein